MPIYEYDCRIHGRFQVIRSSKRETESCPICGLSSARAVSLPAPVIIKMKKQLPYGSGSPGKYVSSKVTGGLPIYVPSFGAMEQEEVDYVAEVAVSKERERLAKNKPLSERNAETKQSLGNIVKIGKSQKEGTRHKTMELLKREGLR